MKLAFPDSSFRYKSMIYMYGGPLPFDVLLHLDSRLDIWLSSPECAPLGAFKDNDPSYTQPTSTISYYEYLDYSMKIFV